MPIFGSVASAAKGRNPFGIASGGVITYFTSTGQTGTITGGKYAVHTFTTNGTLMVTKPSAFGFDFLIVGAGGRGGDPTGNFAQATGGGGGGAGGVIQLLNQSLIPNNYPVTVGTSNSGSSSFNGNTAIGGGGGGGSINLNGGGGGASGGGQAAYGEGSGVNPTGGPGAGTSFQGHSGDTITTYRLAGSGGGAGNFESSIAFTQAGRTLNFNGTSYTYSYGGGAQDRTSQYYTYGSGGFGAKNINGQNNYTGGNGTSGIVMIRYRVE